MKNHSRESLPLLATPAGLSQKIVARIRLEAKNAAWRLACFFGAAAAASLAALVKLGAILASELSASGTLQYLSIVGSDTGLALANWKEIGFSVIESAPVQSAALFLISLFILLSVVRLLAGSVARYSRAIKFA